MAFTAEQQRIIDRHLGARAADPILAARVNVPLTKRQLAFVLEAIEHFHDTKCPLRNTPDAPAACELLEAYEDPRSGALSFECRAPCVAWRDELLEQVVPAFPAPGMRAAAAGA